MNYRPVWLLGLLLPWCTGAEPLSYTPAASEVIDQWPAWDFTTLAAGDDPPGWSNATLRRGSDGTACLVVPGKGLSRRHTVPVEAGQTLRLQVEWRGAGVIKVAHYALGTWGNTLREDRFPLADSNATQRLDLPITAASGALSLGVWTEAAPGKEMRLASLRLLSPAWGGVSYPACPHPEWQVWELADTGRALTSVHFGAESHVDMLRLHGSGTATPWLPSGALLPPDGGACRLTIQAVEPGGGPLVREWSGELPSGGTGRIALPGCTRSLDLRSWAWDTAGTLVRQRTLRLRCIPTVPVDEPAGWDAAPAAASSHSGGQLAIDLEGTRVRPWTRDMACTGKVTVGPGSGQRTLTVICERHDRSEVLRRSQSIAASELPLAISVDFVPPAPDWYRVTTQVTSGSLLLDTSELTLGINPPATTAPLATPQQPHPLLIEEQVFPAQRSAGRIAEQFAKFCADCAAHGSTVVGIGIPFADLAPLPGFHRFADLDARIAQAKAAGLAVEPYIIWHREAWPAWAPWEPPLDQNGRPDDAIAASAASIGMRKVVAAAWRALAEHYRSEPAVIGYTCWNTSFDWTWHDSTEQHYDFCASALAAWRDFAHGASPPPFAATDNDLSPEWRQWADFRDELATRWHLGAFAKAVRAVDPLRRLWVYEAAGGHGAVETRFAAYHDLGVQPAHGGGEPLDMVTHFQLATTYGMAWRNESVSAPARHPIQNDLIAFHALACGLDQAWNTAWNINWANTYQQPGIEASRQRMRQLAGLIEELRVAGYQPAPPAFAQLVAWDGPALAARTFQWHTLQADLELGCLSDSLTAGAISDRTPSALWSAHRLVVANRLSVITSDTAERMHAYAEQGGLLVAALGTGPGLAALAERFGYTVEPGAASTASTAPILVTAHGTEGLFAATRNVVLEHPAQVTPPAGAAVCLVGPAGASLAWRTAVGRGTAVLSAGPIRALASRGWLADLVAASGEQRRFLVSSDDERYPPEGRLFQAPDGSMVLAVQRAIRWNQHRQLIAATVSAGVPQTLDGYAQIHPRRPVTVRWAAPADGSWKVSIWAGNTWSEGMVVPSQRLSDTGVEIALAPGECGFIRCSPAAR